MIAANLENYRMQSRAHHIEENLIPDKCLEPRLGAKSGGYHHSTCQGVCVGWLHDGPVTISFFPKLKEHLSRTEFSSDSDVKTAAKKWLNGQGRDFHQSGLNELVLRSNKCIKRFGDNYFVILLFFGG
ncbi:hypothetical protein AVEN_25143-1 [Araneus ventricosus]|uniref:DUF4817 domain-containing protein n=1 Tax=Araneus ventricosus TaxID=182803 RepID=A0A4Y2IIA8_ARAVE|nr:hypothetical protein AVEN_25143-1 [Araneus ventricosus]